MVDEKIVSLTNLFMRYPNKQVLNGINLDVYRGQIIGYIGPNGAGKSTTIKIILGLASGYDGEVEIFGKNIASGDDSYKRKIGYVPENADVYDQLTPMEYLTFVGELYGMQRQHAEQKAGQMLEAFELEESAHVRLSSFSKGMRQKVLIISSLLHDPDLVFLDEPLSGLDANSVMIIKELLEKLAERGKTIFYSSHIMDVVEKISHRIVLLADGHIAADGSFEELRKESKEGSLEDIFNQLTGFVGHEERADGIADLITEAAGHEE
ncbi:ABC transporter ATP-binding protein [Virgibacillus halophilus]|uniref:ABC transporter ATP-binding protein n=1 Tax=Tigheibacillus halophilus TaxID=361280 RepID=A0ABU5C6G2_9BACI|nr:ABC transporter ATP-binding protein [Virgibacillus halophilus]